MGLGRVIPENRRSTARERRNSRRIARATTLVEAPLVILDDGRIGIDLADGGGLEAGLNGLQLMVVHNETPTGTVDGTNQTFTLTNTPVAGSLRLLVNGVQVADGASDDFTISGAEITFNAGAIPQPGDRLVAHYTRSS